MSTETAEQIAAIAGPIIATWIGICLIGAIIAGLFGTK